MLVLQISVLFRGSGARSTNLPMQALPEAERPLEESGLVQVGWAARSHMDSMRAKPNMKAKQVSCAVMSDELTKLAECSAQQLALLCPSAGSRSHGRKTKKRKGENWELGGKDSNCMVLCYPMRLCMIASQHASSPSSALRHCKRAARS